ncbi:hypothetical protein AtEden1_Chr1g0013161 [Arabidopsis thaliana]
MVSPITFSASGRPRHFSETLHASWGISGWLPNVFSPTFFFNKSQAFPVSRQLTSIGSSTPMRPQTSLERVVKAILHPFSRFGNGTPITFNSTFSHISSNNTNFFLLRTLWMARALWFLFFSSQFFPTRPSFSPMLL